MGETCNLPSCLEQLTDPDESVPAGYRWDGNGDVVGSVAHTPYLLVQQECVIDGWVNEHPLSLCHLVFVSNQAFALGDLAGSWRGSGAHLGTVNSQQHLFLHLVSRQFRDKSTRLHDCTSFPEYAGTLCKSRSGVGLCA